MALVNIPGAPPPIASLQWTLGTVSNNATIDAVGESVAGIGRIRIAGGGSKTISTAGPGRIYYATNTVTFANGSTNVRIGLQDVSLTTGVEDGTFDVYGDLTGGGGGIAATALNRVAMTSGSKTITDGDLVAVVFEMTARGGADAVQIRRPNAGMFGSMGLPYGTQDSGAGPAISSNCVAVVIEFDDGTVGWIEGQALSHYFLSTTGDFISIDSSSSPDEYCAAFSLPYKVQIRAAAIGVSDIDSGDNFEVILYSDPFGTPTVIEAVSVDPDVSAATTTALPFLVTFAAQHTLTAGDTYAIAVRPTTTNAIRWYYQDLGANFVALKGVQPFTSLLMAARTNQSGAFVTTQTYHLPIFYLFQSQIDDGSGGGGGGLASSVFGGQVVR